MTVESTLSPFAQMLARQSIGDRTRDSYGPGVRGYQSRQRRLGRSEHPGALTVASCADYLAEITIQGRLCANTIKGYRSALSTWWRLHTLSDAPCPTTSVAVCAVLQGATRRLALADRAARQARVARALPLTPAVLEIIGAHGGRADSPVAMMMFAAACVGVYAFLRPGELLGSVVHASRTLRGSAIVWRSTADKGLMAPAAALIAAPASVFFTLDLGVTKADQAATNEPTVVAAAPAVVALQRWLIARGAASPEEPLFKLPGAARPLAMGELLAWCGDCCVAGGLPRPEFTGKSMRRGGASAAMALGADRPSIAEAGRWRTPAMVETYAAADAKVERALVLGRRMAAAAAASEL